MATAQGPFLASLRLIMLFPPRKQVIIDVLKSSRLHWPVGLMVSIVIASKITSLENLSEITEGVYFPTLRVS